MARGPEGKVVFVEGALTGETVEARVARRKPSYDLARTTSVLEASPGRTVPACPHFGVCGGCALQHADVRTQMAAKQRGLEESFARIGKVRAETLLPIIYGPAWGYRNRARFSARLVRKKGGVLVGFRERRSSYVAQMDECHVVPQRVSRLIPALKALIGGLSIAERVPQVELAVGDAATVLVFRHLLPFSDADLERLRAFGRKHDVDPWLQPGGPDTARPLDPASARPLFYSLPEFGVRVDFRPTEFTQVNLAVNRVLVSRAVRLLDPRPGERVADLFCGLGNFSLPIARRGAQVMGFEGSAPLVARARENARANGLVAQFEVVDLFKAGVDAWGPFDKMLVDPPRDGAVEIVKALPAEWPRRLVYVSCDPGTLARDAGILVHVQGFRLAAAGVVNMFPHTAHVESIALFER